MKTTLKTVWGWFQEASDNFSELIVINLLWLAFSLLVVTAPAALISLNYTTNLLAHGEAVSARTFLQGMRRHFGKGWLWFLLDATLIFLLSFNIKYYGGLQASWAIWVQGLYIFLLVFWSILQFFVLPFYMEQTDQRLRTAIFNSLVLVMRLPLAVLSCLALIVIIMVLSVILIPAWILITASLCAFLLHKCLFQLIPMIKAAYADKPDQM